jgi:outer membrane protein assembly factor BamB
MNFQNHLQPRKDLTTIKPHTLTLIGLLALCLVVPVAFAAESPTTTPAAKPGPAQGAADVVTTRPAGAYAQVHLAFAPPAGQRNLVAWTYRGALRDGVMPMDGYAAITQPGGELRLRDGRLTGRFERTHARGNVLHGFLDTIRSAYEVDARVIENRIEGTATIGKDAVFKLTGRIIPEADLRAANAVSPTAAWPYFLGPIGGGMAGQAAKAPTAAPADFVLRWRGEAIDIGQSLGSINRFMRTYPSSLNIRTASGGASPVLAGGKIYVSYFRPSPQFPPAPGVGPENFTRTLGGFIEQAPKHPNRSLQMTPETAPRAVLEKHWIGADDVMLCLDAATGQTLWQSVLPARGWNFQHHKGGPFNMSPAVADGRAFAIGMGTDLHAFDAADGRHLWSQRLGGPSIDGARMDGQGIQNTHLSATVIALPGVVVAPQGGTWRGFDPATGAERWNSALPAAHATLAVWRDGERHVLLGNSGGIAAIDAADGKELWRAGSGTGEGKVSTVLSSGRGLGPNGITVLGDQMLAYVDERDASDTKGQSNRSFLMSWRLGREAARPLWRVAIPPVNGEHVPVVMHGRWTVVGGGGRIQVRDLGTGALVAEQEGPSPQNGGYLQAMGDLLLVREDGTHGHASFHSYRVAADGAITFLTAAAAFTPMGGGTSSYHHPIYYPLGDGRMFLRMADGIYCYDVRQPEP